MGVVWATWEEELTWDCAHPKLPVACLLWLLFGLRLKRDRVAIIQKYVFVPTQHPSPAEVRGHFSSRLELVALSKLLGHFRFQHPDQPCVPSKGITDHLGPGFTCSAAQLRICCPGASEAKAWGSMPTHKPTSFACLQEPRVATSLPADAAIPLALQAAGHNRDRLGMWERVHRRPPLAQKN